MQTHNKFFLGIDASKLWFDLGLIRVTEKGRDNMIRQKFDNNVEGLRSLTKWLKAQGVPFNSNTLIVIENTGIYHRLIWEYCSQKGLSLHIGNAAQIKWSLGITRGKDDVTDSERLCMYCLRHADELKSTPVLDPAILQLKDLMTCRSKLIKQINSIKVHLAELKISNSKETQSLLEKAHKAGIDGLKKSLGTIEEELKKIIKSHSAIKNNYDLLLSIPGIGHVTALYIIGCTANFASGISGKQLASYAGVVPFKYQSGTSIKGKSKVHKMANKELKSLLHMGARSIIQHNKEFKSYYNRKLEEGKHDLAIVNAIKNKMLLRVIAVIKNQRKYVDNYKAAA
jgi:transposase